MPETSKDIILAVTTCPDQAAAESLATYLVEHRLAACVNILPQATSIYRWQNALHKESEYLLLIKTREPRYAELQAAICAQHPYELPEIIALPVAHGLPEYLDWVTTCTNR